MEKKEKKFVKKERSNTDQDSEMGAKDGERKPSWRRRERPPVDLLIDYKDTETLRPFLSEGGRIVPSRVNRLNRKQQRVLGAEIKRARHLAMIPMSDRHHVVRN